jgi:hypothetical protein
LGWLRGERGHCNMARVGPARHPTSLANLKIDIGEPEDAGSRCFSWRLAAVSGTAFRLVREWATGGAIEAGVADLSLKRAIE